MLTGEYLSLVYNCFVNKLDSKQVSLPDFPNSSSNLHAEISSHAHGEAQKALGYYEDSFGVVWTHGALGYATHRSTWDNEEQLIWSCQLVTVSCSGTSMECLLLKHAQYTYGYSCEH